MVFALPLLTRLNRKFFGVQGLVLCPTRELADQVATEVRRLGRSRDHLKVVTLCGGVPLRGQAASLAHGAHCHRRHSWAGPRPPFASDPGSGRPAYLWCSTRPTACLRWASSTI